MTGSLQSEVELAFRYDSRRGRPVLERRRAGGLVHLGKPYWDGEFLSLQLVNPTAGIFSGDDLKMNIVVGERCRTALVAPSATRFHCMLTGQANLTQRFEVQSGAWLDYSPEWMIPQKDSDVSQVTVIDLERGGNLAFLDLLAPGRVAHGEVNRFRHLSSRFDLHYDGHLVARERLELRPERGAWPLDYGDWPTCFYGALWLVGAEGDMSESFATLEQQFAGTDVVLGCSRLSPEVGTVRILARRGMILRRALRSVRKTLSFVFPDRHETRQRIQPKY